MGAKAKQPGKGRRANSPSAKGSSKVSARKRHRFYPDSIPPGMAAEVFDVSRIDEDGLELLDDEELVPDSDETEVSSGHTRASVAPHPPRPSIRPKPLTPAEMRIDTPLSYASNPAAVLLEPVQTVPPAPAPRSGAWGKSVGVMLGAGLVALLLGMALGRRSHEQPAVANANAAQAARAPDSPSRFRTFDQAAAGQAIDAAAARASTCRAEPPEQGTLRAMLTFAPTGDVSAIQMAGTLAGTRVGDCFTEALRPVRVSAYDGGPTLVERNIYPE